MGVFMKSKIIFLFFGLINIPGLFASETKEDKEANELQEYCIKKAIDFLLNDPNCAYIEGFPISYKIFIIIESLKNSIIKKNYDEFECLLKPFIDPITKRLKKPSLFMNFLINDLTLPQPFDERLVKIYLECGGSIDDLINAITKERVIEFEGIEGAIKILNRNCKILKSIKRGSSGPSIDTH